jgi:hypothetical protein
MKRERNWRGGGQEKKKGERGGEKGAEKGSGLWGEEDRKG